MSHRRSRTNEDPLVVKGFGTEWSRFPQDRLNQKDRNAIFADYFAIFPWDRVAPDAVGADIGCGSGRWALFVAPRVGVLHCVDASTEAVEVARRNLAGLPNVEFYTRSVGELPFAPETLDFVYSLGVLHHVPDAAAAVQSIVCCVKPGAPVLLYLYYAFENRPSWFRALWRVSEFGRALISKMPNHPKMVTCDLIAGLIYWPLARIGGLLDRMGILPAAWPLSAYRHRAFYVMRTDALDRFGTRLEQRFTRHEVERLMINAGLRNIVFSEHSPFWCAVGIRGEA